MRRAFKVVGKWWQVAALSIWSEELPVHLQPPTRKNLDTSLSWKLAVATTTTIIITTIKPKSNVPLITGTI